MEATRLPNHRIEESARQDYVYVINAYIMPFFGGMRLLGHCIR